MKLPSGPTDFIVTESMHGSRLDAALSIIYPHSATRARRRLFESCQILLDGKRAKPGTTVAKGQKISLCPFEAANTHPAPSHNIYTGIRILMAKKRLYALAKPSGLHTASIAGSSQPSLEEYITAEWGALLDRDQNGSYEDSPCQDNWHSCNPCEKSQIAHDGLNNQRLTENRDAEKKITYQTANDSRRAERTERAPFPCLLTRLDKETSGIVLCAADAVCVHNLKKIEKASKAQKVYFAIVQGQLKAPFSAVGQLNTVNRDITTLTPGVSSHVRATTVYPLQSVIYVSPQSTTEPQRTVPDADHEPSHQTAYELCKKLLPQINACSTELEQCLLRQSLGNHASRPENLHHSSHLTPEREDQELTMPVLDSQRQDGQKQEEQRQGDICTLAAIIIHRGARHQIRAHLASVGHPLWNDPLYSSRVLDDEPFYLHHTLISFDDFIATCLPSEKTWKRWSLLPDKKNSII